MIYNDGSGVFDDVGIGLETSPNTKVYNNTVYIDYPNAIEYRFTATTNTEITNNLTNRAIQSRNGGQATLTTNYDNAQASWFASLPAGDLRVPTQIASIKDQGTSLPVDVTMDIDKTARPQDAANDIGAFEYANVLSVDDFGIANVNFNVFPNPAKDSFTIKSDSNDAYTINIYNLISQPVAAYKNQFLDSGLVINTKQWETGVYFCQILNANGQKKTVKLVVSN